jgi:hypothetical protein
MERDIDALNEEMETAGIRVFVGGLGPLSSTTSLRLQPERQRMFYFMNLLQTVARQLDAAAHRPPF